MVTPVASSPPSGSKSTTRSANLKSKAATAGMLISDLYKSPKSTFSRLRHSSGIPSPAPTTDSLDGGFDPELLSKDRAKQKEAVKKHLANKVRNDWEFLWPPIVRHDEPLESPGSGTPEEAGNGSLAGKDDGIVAQDQEKAHPQDGEAAEQPALREAALLVNNNNNDDDDATEDESSGDADSDASSVYTTVSEDTQHFRPRADWVSDISDYEGAPHPSSPFRFDSPDAVGTAVQASANAKKAKRRKAARDESKWNEGLACFMARRDAWTGARTVRVKPKPPSPISSSRRLSLFWRHSGTSPPSNTQSQPSSSPPGLTSPLSPVSTNKSGFRKSHEGDTTTTTSEPDPRSPLTPSRTRESRITAGSRKSSHDQVSPSAYHVETLLPIPPPILPLANPMRASIQPALYPSLYDKVVVQGLQPTCPINLLDMTRSLVAGWKRDGEWPPRPEALPPAAAVVVVRSKKKQEAAAATAAAVRAMQQDRNNANGAKNGGHSRKNSSATKESRRMSFGFLSKTDKSDDKEKEKDKENQREKDEEVGAGKAIRRSIQRVLGLGHGHGHANGNGHPGLPEEQQQEVTAKA